MKCPKCGERIFSITQGGLDMLNKLGYDDVPRKANIDEDIKCSCGYRFR